jgi:hypothetical protein
MDGAGLDDWGVIERMLPLRWQEKAKELGALRRWSYPVSVDGVGLAVRLSVC